MRLSKLSAYFRLMRFHKPVGILLFVWPPLWALWIAAQGKPHLKNVLIFVLGTIIMRAAGCVINDIADREKDKFVKRTAMRPLTSGEVTLKEALMLFLILLIIAALLAFQLNLFSIKLALITLILSCIYPFTKRKISCPQLFLGLAVATSVPMAFAAELDHLTLLCGLVYLIALVWPVMYDTQYAMVDREDDLRIHIKSTAILFGKYDVVMISLLQGILILLLIFLGIMLKTGLFYYIFIIFTAILFIYQFYLISKRKPENCFKAFLNNQWVGSMIFLGIYLNYWHTTLLFSAL
jgi:4-hydroxybenzoate polyprenyltransferase